MMRRGRPIAGWLGQRGRAWWDCRDAPHAFLATQRGSRRSRALPAGATPAGSRFWVLAGKVSDEVSTPNPGLFVADATRFRSKSAMHYLNRINCIIIRLLLFDLDEHGEKSREKKSNSRHFENDSHSFTSGNQLISLSIPNGSNFHVSAISRGIREEHNHNRDRMLEIIDVDDYWFSS